MTKKTTEEAIFCRERPWTLCKQIVYLFFLSTEAEEQRLLAEKFFHDNIYDVPMLKLWETLENDLIRPRNITFDRNVYFRKQKK